MSYNIQLILVCAGTSCNDIVNSLQKSSKEGKSVLSFYQTFYKGNLKKEPMPHLEEIGIKQMHNCRNNDYIKKLIKSNETIPCIYSTYQLRTIESAMILGSQVAGKVSVCPLPGLGRNTGVSSTDSFKKLKSIFPPKNLAKKYWDGMKLNKSFANITGSAPAVDFTPGEKYGVSNSYSFSSSLSMLRKLMAESVRSNNTLQQRTMIVVCEEDLIKDFLNYYYKSRSVANKSLETIEYSSAWKFDFIIKLKTDSYFSSNKANIDSFNKIYPTSYNYAPLKYEYPDKYTFSFFDKVYPLFKTSEIIPVYYIKFMHLTMCMEREKIKIQSNKMNRSSPKKKNTNTAKKIIIEKPKYNNKTNYEKILENLTK